MANEKFLNQLGLEYYHGRAKTIFENKIEKVKVNGTEQTTNKEVDLKVPTMEFTQRSEEGETWTDSVIIKKDGSNSSYLEIKQNTENGNLLDIYTTNGTVDVPHTLTSKYYVDSKGSVAIDSTSNNKTTFTNGNKTSSITTSPDGIIYTEGAVATEVPSKAYVNDAIAGVTGMEFVLVDTLPAEGEKGKIYLLSNQSAGSNVYDEYIWVQDGANGKFEKMGSTDVDLTDYWNNTNLTAITTAEIDALFA